MSTKLYASNLHNIENDGIIQAMQTLKRLRGHEVLIAWNKRTKLAAHNQKLIGSKVLDDPKIIKAEM